MAGMSPLIFENLCGKSFKIRVCVNKIHCIVIKFLINFNIALSSKNILTLLFVYAFVCICVRERKMAFTN